MEKRKLLDNLEKIHTTELGLGRIKRNLNLEYDDVIKWCCEKIKSGDGDIVLNGKNYYVTFKDFVITINASSYTIITAHRK